MALTHFERAYQIDPQAPRGICAIVDITPTGNDDRRHMENLFKDMNFIVKVHSGHFTGKEIKEEFDKYSRMDHTNFYCFVGIILVNTTDDCIRGTDEEAVNLESLVQTFCLNSTLKNKPKIFLVQKYKRNNRRRSQQTSLEQPDNDKQQPARPNFLRPKLFPNLDANDVLVCQVTNDRGLQFSFLSVYAYVSKKQATCNSVPLPKVLKKAEDCYRQHLRSTMPSHVNSFELTIYDQLIHMLYLPFTGVSVIRRQIRDNPIVDPRSSYRMNSPIKGYCIIINNLGAEVETDCGVLKELFHDNLGFYAEVYTDLSALAIEELLIAVESVDHSRYDSLVVAIFAEGNNEGGELLGSDKKKLSFACIENHFSYHACPTLSCKPKIFVYNLKFNEMGVRRNVAQARESRRRDRYRTIPDDPPDNETRRVSVPDCFRIVNTFERLDPVDVSNRFSAAFANAVWDLNEGNPHTLDFICASTRSKHELCCPIIGRQIEFQVMEGLPEAEQHDRNGAEFKMAYQLWFKVRTKVVPLLRQKMQELVAVARNVRIARAVGAGAGIAGGVVAIGGFVLAPFTFGGSLLLTVAGTGVAAAGGVTSVGASIAGKVIEKTGLREVSQLISIDSQISQIMRERWQSLEQEAERLAERNQGTTREEWIFGILRSGESFLRVGSVGVRSVAAVAGAGGLGVLEGGLMAARIASGATAVVGGVLNVLLLPIGIVDLSVNVHALATRRRTRAIDELDNVIDELARNARSVRDYMNSTYSTDDDNNN